MSLTPRQRQVVRFLRLLFIDYHYQRRWARKIREHTISLTVRLNWFWVGALALSLLWLSQ